MNESMSKTDLPPKLVSELDSNYSDMNNQSEVHRYELIRTVITKRQELKYKQERLEYNIYAGVCQKSILAQRKRIFTLEHEIQTIEYKLKYNLK